MIALLDTHAFIWMDSDPARVSPTVLAYLNDPDCTVFLSLVTVWEIAIKLGTGKLAIRAPLRDLIDESLFQTPLQLLPLRVEHACTLKGLPPIHKDPFDRMLVAQSLVEDAVLLTTDPVIRRYPVRTDW